MERSEALSSGLMRTGQVAVGALLGLRIALDVLVPPIGDEAYYWMWGQNVGLSYLDHPPLHAWLLHIVGLLFGWNLFSLRVLTWFTLAGTLWIFWLWAKRFNPQRPATWFWPTAAIYLASPLFFIMSAISFHDHLLIFLCLASAHLFLVFTARWESTRRGYLWLYAAAAVLGLAVLTKYNGVLFGLGIALFLVLRPQLRPLWRTPHLYLAALLAIAMQAPVFWWNLTESFASYNFHLSQRWGGGVAFQPLGAVRFLVVSLLFVSPFLLPAIWRALRGPAGAPFDAGERMLARSVLAASGLAMLALSFFVEVYFYWDVLAVLLLVPLLVGTVGRWGFALHAVYGVLVAAAVVANYGILPLGALTGQQDWYAASNFGWPQTAARVAALRAEHDVGFIATPRYSTAAQLGYAMRDPGVVAVSGRPDEYDYWFDAAAHKGEDALIVSDSVLGTAEIAPHFDSLTLLERLPILRFGHEVYVPEVFLGRHFDGRSGP